MSGYYRLPKNMLGNQPLPNTLCLRCRMELHDFQPRRAVTIMIAGKYDYPVCGPCRASILADKVAAGELDISNAQGLIASLPDSEQAIVRCAIQAVEAGLLDTSIWDDE